MRIANAARILLFLSVTIVSLHARQSMDGIVDRELPKLLETYRYLHSNPEISYHEEKTSEFMAKELRRLGFEVTERVGKYEDARRVSYGLVAVMKNGDGPAVMVRTDLDGLPIAERTGLPYASTVTTKDDAGQDVSVMHACGHDIHMTSFLGTATLLSQLKDRWKGTVIMIGQPCEERGAGAHAMLNGGLYTRFPKPDFILALHDNATMDAGTVGVCEGFTLASVTSVDILVRGVGGHGAYPQSTKDPVVIASEIVLALQTIVSRENSPLDPAVVTVGSIHGGTKHNIIPDEVRLQITVRAYKEDVRKKILASIERIARGIALAAGVPSDRMPVIRIDESEFTASTYNNPEFTKRVARSFESALGKEKVLKVEPVMGGEDFGAYSLDDKIPLCIFWLGAIDPAKVERSRKDGIPLPSLHSSQFTPLPEPTIRAGMKATAAAVMDLLAR
ncbi:MAG: amidohydrolase [Ignavibacteriales bacterium]|nr:amidohydrolase [Ignavibacteriales bacterium]